MLFLSLFVVVVVVVADDGLGWVGMGWERWVRFMKQKEDDDRDDDDDDDDEANAWPISRFLAQRHHIIKTVNLVRCLCHELSAKELDTTGKKWGFTSQNMGVAMKLGRVQLATRLTHDKTKKVLKAKRGDQKFDSEELGEFSIRRKKSQSVAGKEDCEGSISSSKVPGG